MCLKHAWVLTSASKWVSLLRLSPFNKFCLNVSLASDQLESYTECNKSRTSERHLRPECTPTHFLPVCKDQGSRFWLEKCIIVKNNQWNRPWKVLKLSHGYICEKHGLRKFSYCCQSSFSSTYVRKAVLGPNTKSIQAVHPQFKYYPQHTTLKDNSWKTVQNVSIGQEPILFEPIYSIINSWQLRDWKLIFGFQARLGTTAVTLWALIMVSNLLQAHNDVTAHAFNKLFQSFSSHFFCL